MGGSDTPAIRLVGLKKAFGRRVVLDGISLDVRRGESLTVMGPSGEGKTVLLKHFIGLLRPDAGRVEVEGDPLWESPRAVQRRIRQRFGMVFQEGALFDSMTVLDNVAFPLRRHTRMTASEVLGRVQECLDLVRLPGTERLRPAELSTGMRRRVGLARALALRPEILLFDEPTAGLDPVLVSVIDGLIVDLTQRLQVTCVTVTHDLRTAQTVGERVALLFRGRLVADAPRERFFLLDDPAVQQFIHGRTEGPITANVRVAR